MTRTGRFGVLAALPVLAGMSVVTSAASPVQPDGDVDVTGYEIIHRSRGGTVTLHARFDAVATRDLVSLTFDGCGVQPVLVSVGGSTVEVEPRHGRWVAHPHAMIHAGQEFSVRVLVSTSVTTEQPTFDPLVCWQP